LSPLQLSAALAHERAHLAGRHHLVLALVYAAGRALPWVALFAQAGPAVAGLLEMRADDAAAAYHGRATVAAALAAMSAVSAPAGALGASGPAAAARAARLCRAEPAWRRRLGRTALALTVAALASGPYLAAALPPCPHPLW
jgi:Zn-dependent protease with chaperone function